MGHLVKLVSEAACTQVARIVLALVLVVGILVLLGINKVVPDSLWVMGGAAIGFFFGGYAKTSG